MTVLRWFDGWMMVKSWLRIVNEDQHVYMQWSIGDDKQQWPTVINNILLISVCTNWCCSFFLSLTGTAVITKQTRSGGVFFRRWAAIVCPLSMMNHGEPWWSMVNVAKLTWRITLLSKEAVASWDWSRRANQWASALAISWSASQLDAGGPWRGFRWATKKNASTNESRVCWAWLSLETCRCNNVTIRIWGLVGHSDAVSGLWNALLYEVQPHAVKVDIFG